jgi:hypothetical protein
MPRGLAKVVPGPDGLPERLNVPAVAARCGVTPRTAYTWVRTGVLPATKIGPKLWWVLASDLDAFLAGGGAASASSSPGASEPAVPAPKPEKVSKPGPVPEIALPAAGGPLKPMSTRAQRRAKKTGK